MVVVGRKCGGNRTKPERQTKFLLDLMSGFPGGSRTLDHDRCYADRFQGEVMTYVYCLFAVPVAAFGFYLVYCAVVGFIQGFKENFRIRKPRVQFSVVCWREEQSD